METTGSEISDSRKYDGYIVEVSLPSRFSGDVGEALVSESEDMNSRLQDDYLYMSLNENETFSMLDHLDLDPFKPELPLLLVLDKHPLDVEDTDEEVVIKLGALERENDIGLVLDGVLDCLENDEFMKGFTSGERKDELLEVFEDIAGVKVLLISTVLMD